MYKLAAEVSFVSTPGSEWALGRSVYLKVSIILKSDVFPEVMT